LQRHQNENVPLRITRDAFRNRPAEQARLIRHVLDV
jgi:hypothetical protein